MPENDPGSSSDFFDIVGASFDDVERTEPASDPDAQEIEIDPDLWEIFKVYHDSIAGPRRQKVEAAFNKGASLLYPDFTSTTVIAAYLEEYNRLKIKREHY